MAEQLDINNVYRMVKKEGHILMVTLMMQSLILIVAVLLGNSAVAQEDARITIDIAINNPSSGEDYIEYYYQGILDRKISANMSVTVFSGRKVKFIARGNFNNWQGSSCGNGSGNTLEFIPGGDCSVVANFGTNTETGADTDRRRRR